VSLSDLDTECQLIFPLASPGQAELGSLSLRGNNTHSDQSEDSIRALCQSEDSFTYRRSTRGEIEIELRTVRTIYSGALCSLQRTEELRRRCFDHHNLQKQTVLSVGAAARTSQHPAPACP